ncbi:MAG: TerB family tellurite resistance protein [Planctomycetaceae bacterium]|jgi:uncharacterized tellurite resistance protein B-like protein|nr:TerB family tellurite resistance protein [Planctomycetaceae bacterium]
MTDFQTAPIAEVVKSILADGVIDDAEVAELRKRLYADSKIDKEEAEALFEINDAVKGKANSAAWTTLFVDAIADFLLKDETSPGVVDEAEGEWLFKKLSADGEIDANEKALLKTLKDKAKFLPHKIRELN